MEKATVLGDVLQQVGVPIDKLLGSKVYSRRIYGIVQPDRRYEFIRTQDGEYVVTPDIVILHEPDERIVLGVRMNPSQAEASYAERRCTLLPLRLDVETQACYVIRQQVASTLGWLDRYRLVKVIYTPRDQPTYGQLDEIYGVTTSFSRLAAYHGTGTRDVTGRIVHELETRGRGRSALASQQARAREAARESTPHRTALYVKRTLESCFPDIKTIEGQRRALYQERWNRLSSPEYVKLDRVAKDLSAELNTLPLDTPEYRDVWQQLRTTMAEWNDLRRKLLGDVDERIDKIDKRQEQLTATVNAVSNELHPRILYLLRLYDAVAIDQLPPEVQADINARILAHCPK
jgi:hypothetical protein